jgi:hypothetical protein
MMSARSIYLRDQAAKCEWHAMHISDGETQVSLRKLAAQYIEEATTIETKEQQAGPLPPSFWQIGTPVDPQTPDAEPATG